MADQLLILGGSLVAVMILAAIVRWMGLGKVQLADRDQARQLAEDMLSGFKAKEIFLSNDGAAAILIGKDGSVGVLKQHGAHFAARKLTAPISANLPRSDTIRIDSGEARYGAVTLRLQQKDADKLLTMM